MLRDQHRCNHMKNMKIIFNENSYLIVIFEILLPKWQKDVKIENEKFSETILNIKSHVYTIILQL